MSIKYDFELTDKHYFAKEAAEYLGVTEQRFDSIVRLGKVKPSGNQNNLFVFSKEDLNKVKLKIDNVQEPFKIDSPVKKEAFNYSVLKAVTGYSESKLDGLFSAFSALNKTDEFMSEDGLFDKYSAYFKIDIKDIEKEFEKQYEVFLKLNKDDVVVKRGNPDYPILLARIAKAPRFLYLRGRTELAMEPKAVSVIGSRNASERACRNARSLAASLGRNGFTVVSGLALGIDANAHLSALEGGYNTIAVIGTPLNKYYPKENSDIQKRIEKEGLVISPFSPAEKTQRWFFPYRDGVMSGLSLASAIMEAGDKSGALIQADYAFKQGRLVMFPSSLLADATIKWPHKYLEKGAICVSTPGDVINKLKSGDISGTDDLRKTEEHDKGEQILFDFT